MTGMERAHRRHKSDLKAPGSRGGDLGAKFGDGMNDLRSGHAKTNGDKKSCDRERRRLAGRFERGGELQQRRLATADIEFDDRRQRDVERAPLAHGERRARCRFVARAQHGQ